MGKFLDELLGLVTRDVAGEDFLKILIAVAFAVQFANAKGQGPDSVRSEAAGEPESGDRFAAGHLGPGTVEPAIEGINHLMTEHAIRTGLGEEEEDVQQELRDWALFLGGDGQANGRAARRLGPMAAREVGQGEEGLPDVRSTVIQVGGKGRLSGGDGVGVVDDKACALTREAGAIEFSESLTLVVDGLALHADDDTAVGEGVGEMTDGGNGFGAPGGKADEAGGILDSGFWVLDWGFVGDAL